MILNQNTEHFVARPKKKTGSPWRKPTNPTDSKKKCAGSMKEKEAWMRERQASKPTSKFYPRKTKAKA